jgi:Glycosyl transferase family 2
VVTKARLWHLLRRAQGVVRIERRLDELPAAVAAERRTSAEAQLQQLSDQLARLESRVLELQELVAGDVRMTLRAIVSEDAENRRRLWRARASPGYEDAFHDPAPLVSVVIPTFDRPELLRTRSLPSVLRQTHERLDVVVVGDHAAAEVAEAIGSIDDPRVSFHNLTQRLPARPDPRKQWSVASVMARNEGFRLAHGSWLMSFDDDDELHPDAVQRLLAEARERRAEVVYGRFRQRGQNGSIERGEFPPRHGEFSWQSGVVHSALSFFERELFAADFGLPNDIFLAEAMLRAGVRFAMIPDVICDLYPSSER